MDNNSYRHQFIEEYASDSFSEMSFRTLESMWKRIERAEKALGKRLEDGYTKEEYIHLFGKLNVATTQVLIVMKSKIMQYIRFLQQEGVVTDQCAADLKSINVSDLNVADCYDRRYFKDFASLQSAIDSTLVAAERVDDAIFGTAITALYLAWCGLSIEQAIEVKKADVQDDCIITAGKTIKPIPQIMDYIQEYRDAVGYQSLSKALINLKYVPSEWLLRTTRRGKLDVSNHLRILINQFGNSSEQSKNLFNYDKVYWSGIYMRAYSYECANGQIEANDISKIEQVFEETYPNTALANRRLYDYHLFRDHFYPPENA